MLALFKCSPNHTHFGGQPFSHDDLWVRQTDTIAAGNERYIDLATALSAGTYKVWVQTWNATDGYGPWSEGLEFVVP